MIVNLTIKHNGETVRQSRGLTDDWQTYVNDQMLDYETERIEAEIEAAGGLDAYLQSLPEIQE